MCQINFILLPNITARNNLLFVLHLGIIFPAQIRIILKKPYYIYIYIYIYIIKVIGDDEVVNNIMSIFVFPLRGILVFKRQVT